MLALSHSFSDSFCTWIIHIGYSMATCCIFRNRQLLRVCFSCILKRQYTCYSFDTVPQN